MQYFWLIVLATLLLAEARLACGKNCLEDGESNFSLMIIPRKATYNNDKKTQPPIVKSSKKKNFAKIKFKLLTNESDFQMVSPHKNKDLNDFNALFNETKNPSPSSLYEFNFTNNKSDNNSITFQILPFLDSTSQNNKNAQQLKQIMITLFRINFF